MVESINAYVLWESSRSVVLPLDVKVLEVVMDSMKMLSGLESSGSNGYLI